MRMADQTTPIVNLKGIYYLFVCLNYYFLFHLELVMCRSPPDIKNTLIALPFTKKIVGDEVRLSCREPYLVMGSPVLTCSTNGSWVGNMTCSKPLTPLSLGHVGMVTI